MAGTNGTPQWHPTIPMAPSQWHHPNGTNANGTNANGTNGTNGIPPSVASNVQRSVLTNCHQQFIPRNHLQLLCLKLRPLFVTVCTNCDRAST
jgi:hypothetical protein